MRSWNELSDIPTTFKAVNAVKLSLHCTNTLESNNALTALTVVGMSDSSF